MAVTLSALLSAGTMAGALGGPAAAYAEGGDRTDSPEYTAARADYWAAREAREARRAERRSDESVASDDGSGEGHEQGGGGEVAAAPAPVAVEEGYPTNAQLAALRMCESTDDYGINTGNGYYGAYQFSLTTWWWLGYTGYPHHAPPAVQDQAVRDLYAIFGWTPWPACSRYLGFA